MKVLSLGLAICAALAVTTRSVEAKGTICNTGSGFADTGDSYSSDKPAVPVSSSTGSDGITQVGASGSTAGSDVTQVAGSSSSADSDVTQQTGSSSTTGDDATQVAGSGATQQTSSTSSASSTTGSDATQVASSSSTYSDDTPVTSASSSGSVATTTSQNNDDLTTQGSAGKDNTTATPAKGSADGTTSANSDESDVNGSASSNNDATPSKGDNASSNSKGVSSASSSSVQDGSASVATTSSQIGQQDSSVGGSKATSSNAGQNSAADSNTSSQASSPTVAPASFSASGSIVDSTPTQSSTASSSTDSTPTQSSTAASASSSSSTPTLSSKSGSSDSSTPVQQTSTTASGSSDSSTPVQQTSASGSSDSSTPVQQTSTSGSDSSTPIQQTSTSASGSSGRPQTSTSTSGSSGSSTPIQQTSISASGSSGSPQTSTSGSSGSSTATQSSVSTSSAGSASSSSVSSSAASSSSASASTSSSSSSSSFTKVTRLGVRVQGDMPEWNAEYQRFVSAYYDTFDEKYRAVLDTVNMASVEGALKYVQAECINASVITDCERKNNIKYVVFYQTTTVQPTAAMDYYVNATDEYDFAVESCPFMAMDGGQCDPNEDGSFPDVCNQYIGAGGQPELGFCVGGTLQDNEAIAPYPHNYWFSFPNSCPQQLWDDKTDSCRSEYAGGMCAIGQEPDGVTCSFTYEILGYILLDDVVGITSMVNPATGTNYADYYEFCEAGGVEFSVSIVTGVLSLLTNVLSSVVDLVEGIEFWANPGDSDANAERVEKLVSAYDALVSANATTSDGGLMRALPTVSELSALNPPCYENSPLCAESEFGCKRSYRSQICQVCTSDDSGCEKQ